ncbi:MAG: ATP-binding cassette domain-containing protein [Polyangiaceae bacterium]
MADGTKVVVAQDVVKRVRDGRDRRTVLDALSFELDRGEFSVLRGPSGSGKTTLLAIVGGMLSPTSGEVLLDGEPITRLREAHRAEIRRRKVGFVFQDLQLVDSMTVMDNVLLPRVPDGVRSEDLVRARTLLDRFGVGSLAPARARQLSGGERQRVAIARAMLLDPPLLLLDEPTAHIDDARAAEVTDLLASLAAEGRAVLVSTHDPRVARHPAVRRVFDLAGGRLVTQAEST